MRIYIANLGKYNEGELVGEWINLPASEEDLEELYVRIKLGHYNEDEEYVHGYEKDGIVYEEYAIHDYECDINGVEIGEYSSISELNELAERLEEFDDNDMEIIEAILEVYGGGIEYAIEVFENGNYTYHSGIYSLGDLAQQLMDEGLLGDVDRDSVLYRYFDYEAFGRDLGFDGYTITENGCICIH